MTGEYTGLNNYLSLIGKDIRKLWNGLNLPQKFAIVVLILAAAGAISYFIAKSTEPNWGVLYSDLAETDAVAVVENLKKAGYPYKISEDKKSILVPIELKEDLRLLIAEKDVIHDSTPGFELLDKIQLGATDFQNKLTRQRIFQGELTRTIEKIRGISKARVQIADPERSIFDDKDEPPSASVMLILEPGYKIKPEQVKAIKNLVAYGVPRLTPEKVFLSDENGNPLSDEVNQNSGGMSDYQMQFEENTAKKVRKVLEKLVGSSNLSVQVSAIMNFDSARATIEKYLPATENAENPEGIVVSTQSETEAYGNNGSSATMNERPANLPVTNDNSKSVNYQKTKVQKNYNISKEIKQVVYAPGTIQRMTIGVAINKVLTTTEREQLRNLVITASGANLERGDLITITDMQFAPEAIGDPSKVASELQNASVTEFWVRTVAPLVVVLILGLAALFVLSSLLKKPLSGSEVYSQDEYYEDETEETSMPLLETPNLPAIEAKLEPELEKMRAELNNTILADPAEAARLIQSFIKD